MADMLGWLATTLMTLAAVMVASNAGTRIIGWGASLAIGALLKQDRNRQARRIVPDRKRPPFRGERRSHPLAGGCQ